MASGAAREIPQRDDLPSAGGVAVGLPRARIPRGEDASALVDEVEYELPLGALGRLFGAPIARRQLERLFAYRHEVTRATCLAMAGRS